MVAKRSVLRMLGIGVVVLLAWPRVATAQRLKPLPERNAARAQASSTAIAGSPWTPLANQPKFLNTIKCAGAANPLLLTDGTVIVQEGGCQNWWKLTPDNSGSYVNGTWSQIASLPADYSPLYHSSAVLPDGRVVIMGGEYNFFVPDWTNLGAIYDPVVDQWTSLAAPPFFTGFGPFAQTIGDSQSVVLANGTMMQANCCTTEQALLDAGSLTWTQTGSGKFDINDEEGWTLLPSGNVLTVDAYVFAYDPAGTNSEIYDAATGAWSSAGSTQVQLWDSAANCGGENFATFEVGPGVLRPDGTVFFAGADTCRLQGHPTAYASGNTAIYDSSTGVWTAGPSFPIGVDIADGPAALETDGKVLMMASSGFGNKPSFFFEWDGNNLTQVPPTPNAHKDGSYFGNMLALPSGQILVTDFSNDIELYTPSGLPQPQWAPVIKSSPATVKRGGTYTISGVRFNGMSQAAAYGDDVQGATNYPMVRITNLASRHVFYSRTHDHSSMAVASKAVVSTQFDVPLGMETGASEIEVVANGIASAAKLITVK